MYKDTKKLTVIALLLALQIVLGRVTSLNFGNVVKINLSFLPLAFTGALFGPVVGAISGGLGDILGYFIGSSGGGYLPGIGVTAMISGALYGIFLYNQRISLKRVVPLLILVNLGGNLFLNTYWLSLFLNKGYWVLWKTRFPVQVFNVVYKSLILMAVLPRGLEEVRRIMDVQEWKG